MTAPWTARVLTLFPEMFPGPLGHSLLGRALEHGLWRLDVRDIRDAATDRHRTVDDTPAGGGAGMVMRADVAAAALDAAAAPWPVLYLSPRGAPLHPGPRPRPRRRSRRHPALRPVRRHRRARPRRAADRGGQSRRFRDDRRRDRRDGLDRRHGSAYRRRSRERLFDGGGILRRRAVGVSAIHPPDRLGRSAYPRGSPLGSSRTDRRLATAPRRRG